LKLKRMQVQNFKCIDDSTTFRIDRVTCLVGKNESGKSALLQGLYKLNPVLKYDASYDALVNYPRRRWSAYKARMANPDPVLTTWWELDDEDVTAFARVFGPAALTSRTVVISKNYTNTVEYAVDLDEKRVVEHVLRDAGLHEEELQPLRMLPTVADVVKALQETTEASPRQQALLAALTKTFQAGVLDRTATKMVQERLPKFLYFADYYKMKGEIAVDAIKTKQAANPPQALTPGEQVFLALLELAGTDLAKLEGETKFESLIAELEAISNFLTDEIFEYWSQNKHLKVKFMVDHGKPGDPEPFNAGLIFRARIENERHRASVPFGERSTGFVWFFSFLVWFSQVRRKYGENLVVLLDEPGLSLHARAQADLLRYINEQLAPDHQVVYTSHSPFMVDPENLLGVRTVEDVVTDDGKLLGTKVGDDIFSTDADTVFPLQGALGYDMTQTLFVGKHTLVVEGPSDLIYLKWFSRELEVRGRQGLDRRWVIAPAGGIDKVASFVALFGGKKLHIAVLTDFVSGEKRRAQELKVSKLLRAGHVFTAADYAGQPEADVEDILGRATYIELVNRCYDLKARDRLAVDVQAQLRVVKDVEAHFRTLPPTAPVFDHYAVAEYLMLNGAGLQTALPELDAALDRFERLFKDLNRLLPTQ